MKPISFQKHAPALCALVFALAPSLAAAQAAQMDHAGMTGMDHGSMDHGQAPSPDSTDSAESPESTDSPESPKSHQGMDHAEVNHDAPAAATPPIGSLPASDGEGPRGYDSYGIHPHMMDNAPTWQVLFDKFGASRNRDGQNALEWDGRFWFGTATDRLLVKSEGARESGGGSDGKVEAFWSHAISPFWDLQLGARRDIGAGPKRNWAAVGVEGLLPYNIELTATAYAGPSGRSALALKAEYDLLLTQRLIFTPELQASVYSKDDPQRGIGSGLSQGSLSLRLRYEVTRELAPYVGVSFERKFGQTAGYASDAGESRSQAAVIAGVRFWF
ncbi:copper resistance protein B [Achromobacter mucicolens]|uniref:copper resistance protein B n=1 Tax=Achromobacter mucicolens TaxID=1389922 RepID=UPI001F0C85F2|nr:copper resistance protein B [Achromobacter mucicolens]